MGDRRTAARMKALLPATYKLLESSQTRSSLTKDISGSGVGLFTGTHLEPGTVIESEVGFPNRGRPIRFLGQVMWSGPLLLAGQRGRIELFETGLRLMGIAPEDQVFILQQVATEAADRLRPRPPM